MDRSFVGLLVSILVGAGWYTLDVVMGVPSVPEAFAVSCGFMLGFIFSKDWDDAR